MFKKITNIFLFLILILSLSSRALADSSSSRSVWIVDKTTRTPADVNTRGQLHVVLKSEVDDNNSTVTPLGIGADFTGTATETLDYGTISVNVYSNVASAASGLVFEQSSDGTNWDIVDTFSYLAGTGKTYTVQTAAQFFRVLFTNGAVGQTSFRLQTILKKTASIQSSHRIGDNLSPEDDGQLTIAIIKGQNPSGDYVDYSATAGGNFKISLEEYDVAFTSDPFPVRDPILSVSRGLLTGITHVNKFGAAIDGVQLTDTDIWDRADAAATQNVWVAPTVARTHTIASTDANDTDGGTGAQTVTIFGLTSWGTAETSETVTMDTATPPVTASSYVIIHRMFVASSGASGPNLGIITATATGDATITAQINIGEGQTQMAIYGVPSTQTAYVTDFYFNLHQDAPGVGIIVVDFKLLVATFPDVEEGVFVNKHQAGVMTGGTTDFTKEFKPYKKILGPCIIKIQAISDTADATGTAGFDVILVDN